MQAPDPGVFMRQFLSQEAASKANKWQGRNITRWQSPKYDRLYQQSEAEIDPVKRAALFIAMNDLVVRNVVVIPVVARPKTLAVANNLHVVLSGWDASTFAIQDWYRDV
jgi:peptide/nickel transport system substrate-binding protein